MTERNREKAGTLPDRTTLALNRIIPANEQTCVAWIRTGSAALIPGLAAVKFLLEALPLRVVRAVAVILIVFSAAAFILAARSYRNLQVYLKDSDVVMGSSFAVIGLCPVLTIQRQHCPCRRITSLLTNSCL